jgi:2-polyprenyl-3-methyl-5-hydroxy-6-metoxy-1,4-benzoquinol methylase
MGRHDTEARALPCAPQESDSMSNGFDDARAMWDGRFAREDYIFGTAPNAFLASQQARLAPGQRALCVADGEGRNSVWLARQGLAVTAFDISPVGVDKARRLATQAGVVVNYQVAEVAAWLWTPEAYDLVVAIFVQFAPPALRAQLFAGMLATLKPGGLLLLEGYTPDQVELRTGGPGRVDHLYTEALLREAFAGHEILLLSSYRAVLAEGTQHAGESALIDCVVRKRALAAG